MEKIEATSLTRNSEGIELVGGNFQILLILDLFLNSLHS